MTITTRVLIRWKSMCTDRCDRFKRNGLQSAASFWGGKARAIVSIISVQNRKGRKRRNKTYMCGPVSGCSTFMETFSEWEDRLRAAGFDPLNPCTIGGGQNLLTWYDYMRRSIRALMKCGSVFTMPGAENSRGANLELDIARGLDMPVYVYEDGRFVRR